MNHPTPCSRKLRDTDSSNLKFPYESHVYQEHAGLKGANGANALVKLLHNNHSIRHLILGYNDLGDDGCVRLFEYLKSEHGASQEVAEIRLESNIIGDVGLWAIIRYIEGNKSLKSLSLRKNSFRNDEETILHFTLAVNKSKLQTLDLSYNPSLADVIISTFLPNLSSDSLSELHLSSCSLGPNTTNSLFAYLASHRSFSLQTLKVDGNPFGIASIERMIKLLERGNWSLGRLDVRHCLGDDAPTNRHALAGLVSYLNKAVLARNTYLRCKVGEEALLLLSCARALHTLQEPRFRLPIELLLHILSFIAPSLSTAQFLRVYANATSVGTPTTNLVLPHPRPRHRHIPMSDEWGIPRLVTLCVGCVPRAHKTAALFPLREPPKDAWLRSVGCDRYEAHADNIESEMEEENKVNMGESTK